MQNYRKSDLVELFGILIAGLDTISLSNILSNPQILSTIFQMSGIIKYGLNFESYISKSDIYTLYLEVIKSLELRDEQIRINQLHALGIANRSIFKKTCYYGFTKNSYVFNQYRQKFQVGSEKFLPINKNFSQYGKKQKQDIASTKSIFYIWYILNLLTF